MLENNRLRVIGNLDSVTCANQMASRFPRACKKQISYEETGESKEEKGVKFKHNKNTLYDIKIIKRDAVRKRTKSIMLARIPAMMNS